VDAEEIHYFAASGDMGGAGGSDTSSSATEITSWVESNYKSVTIGTQTFYDLTQPLSV
jgi:hypothetical protein